MADQTKINVLDQIRTAGSSISGIAGKVKQDKITVDRDFWANQPTSNIYYSKNNNSTPEETCACLYDFSFLLLQEKAIILELLQPSNKLVPRWK